MREQLRDILDFVQDHRSFCESPKEACRNDGSKIPLQRIVEADIVKLLTRFMPEKSGLARLTGASDQYRRKPGKGFP